MSQDDQITIFVPGNPFGKERSRSRIIDGRSGQQFTSHYTPTKTRKYEKLIADYGRLAMIGKELIKSAPIKFILVAVMEVPKSWPQWKKDLAFSGDMLPTAKPDCSNILKAAEDGLNGIVWGDDSQITSPRPSKRYRGLNESTGTLMSIQKIDKYPSTIKKKPF